MDKASERNLTGANFPLHHIGFDRRSRGSCSSEVAACIIFVTRLQISTQPLSICGAGERDDVRAMPAVPFGGQRISFPYWQKQIIELLEAEKPSA